uniref:Uncharacterized protein n=1 Tax=Acrobeloides nanus TaxID=290746 RepID=A0A914DHN7_9BILA
MFDNVTPSIPLFIFPFCIYLCIIPQLVMCRNDSKTTPEVTLAPDSRDREIVEEATISKISKGSITVTDTVPDVEIESKNLITEAAFDFPKRNSRFMAVISFKSWDEYRDFAKSTCREDEITQMMQDPPNYMESGYFSWEENMFHQQLRKRIFRGDFFPETAKGNYTELLRSPLAKELDPRLLMPPPKTFCLSEEDLEEDLALKLSEQSIEKSIFDDIILNRIFTVHSPMDSKSFKVDET